MKTIIKIIFITILYGCGGDTVTTISGSNNTEVINGDKTEVPIDATINQ